MDIVLRLLKSFWNEPTHESFRPVKLDKTHNMHSNCVPTLQTSLSVVSHGGSKKRIFHLRSDVVQAMGQFDRVLLLVLIEHLQLDV